MSGRRTWVGYGFALSLALLVAASGCTQGAARSASPKDSSLAESSTATEVVASVDTPTVSGDLAVNGIKLVEDEGQSGVFIKLTNVPDRVEHFTLHDPNRLVVDIYGAISADAEAIERSAEGDQMVNKVSVDPQGDHLRVTVDLKGGLPQYTLNDLQKMVVAFLGERSTSSAHRATRSQVLYASGEPSVRPSALPRPREAAASGTAVTASSGSAGRSDFQRSVAEYTGEKISLDFKDADVLNVLRILAEVSGLNVVATDDVEGRVTVRLVDVPWDQALDIILQSNRLDTVQIGNVLRVSTVTRLKEEREAQLAAQEAARELEALTVAYISVNYMKVDDEDDPLIPKVEDLLSDRGKVQIDARTNQVIVRDIGEGISAARELIRQLDRQTPQVLIESNVVEATDTFTRDLGIQWGYSHGVGPQFGTSTGKNFPSSFVLGGGPSTVAEGNPGTFFGRVPGTGPANPLGTIGLNSGPTIGGAAIPSIPIPFIADFPAQTVQAGEGAVFDIALGSIDGGKALNAKLSALEKEGKAKIVSRPKVVTLNNLAAKIEAVRIFRVRLPGTGTVVSTGAGGVAGGGASATEEIRTGITLEVKPQVSADGYILLEIDVKSSTADFTQQVDNIPAEVSRQAITNVLIKDGETVVLGGVFRNSDNDTESGLPYLRKIPGLGFMFKRMFRDRQREELIVFITPRIVNSGGAQFTNLPEAKSLWEQRPR